jgi:dipeptidyl aminopeptidase/acylaminoacyl peptidase
MIRFFLVLSVLFGAAAAAAQPPAPLTAADIAARLHQSGRVEIAGGRILIERYDFTHDGAPVEAVIVRPSGPERRPGLLLIPGHTRTAIDMLPASVRFARAGFATVAVSQPGYGGSVGPPDFAGPRTFAALRDAAERFAREPYVDAAHMGIYGYSRGALAAAELAARTDLFRASVFGGGIYDFRAAYDQVSLAGIRANMAAEAGLGRAAVRFRSPIRDMTGLDGPVLIVHGADDANAPPAQARALDARLTALGREHELLILPGRDHGLPVADIIGPATAFFTRNLIERR